MIKPLCQSNTTITQLRGMIALALFLFAILGFVPKLKGQAMGGSSTTQFVVLKTGSVYSGQLEFGGGKYIIHRNNGSSVRFHQGEVDFVTYSLEAAYLQLRARLREDDVIGQQRLAMWCLKNRQLESALQQQATLQKLPGGHKTLRLLERQIEELASPRNEQTPIQRASFTEPIETGVRRLPDIGPQIATREELKASIDSYDRESLREFNRGVHLRIVNGCAAASCHGNADSAFRLWRVDNRGGLTSTGVQRNLHSITQYLDRQDPLKSPLLQYVSEVHGGMDAPAYDPTSHHYHAIRDWIRGTAVESLNPEALDTNPISQTGFLDRAHSPQPPAMRGELIPAPVDLSVEEKKFVPRDEFDPELFNRKYGEPSQKPLEATGLVPMALPKPVANPLPGPAKLPRKRQMRSLPPVGPPK